MKNFYLPILCIVIATAVKSQPSHQIHPIKEYGFQQFEETSAVYPGYPPNEVKGLTNLGNPPAVNWEKQFGGDGADVGQDIVTDDAGNSYITGYFSGTFSFQGVNITSVGSADAFVAKINGNGSLLWIRKISCGPYETARGTGIALDHLDNIYVAGYYNGSSLQAGSFALTRTGTEDIFLARLDANGNFTMAGHFGVAGMAKLSRTVDVDDEGNAFVIAGAENISTHGGSSVLKFDVWGHCVYDYTNGARFHDVAIRSHFAAPLGPMPACITIDPPNATAYDSMTLTFNPALSCYIWQSLVGSSQVFMHSGVTIGGSSWQHAVPYNSTGDNGQSTQLTANGDGTYSIRFRPSAFYGLTPALNVTQLCIVFNDGQWDSRDGRDFDNLSAGCIDIFVPLTSTQSPPSVYLTGHLTSNVNFGETILNASNYTHAPFLAKCNPWFGFSWAVQGVSSGSGSVYNWSNSVAIDAGENVYFGGLYRKNLTFGGFPLSNSQYDYAPYLVKCTSAGIFEWAKGAAVESSGYYSAGYIQPVKIAVNSEGAAYITDYLWNNAIAFGPFPVGGTGWVIAKYGSDGSEQGVAPKDGMINSIYASTVSSETDYTGSLGTNAVIVQNNTASDEQWRIVSSGNSGNARNANLAVDHNGNLYSLNRSDVAVPMFGNASGVFLAKMNPAGNVLWSLPFDGVVTDANNSEGYGNYLAIDQEDNIYSMGYFKGTLTIGGVTLTNLGDNNGIYIVKIDPSGSVIWLKQLSNGWGYMEVYSIAADFENNIIASGIFRENLEIGTTTLVSAGDLDAFAAKLDRNGNVQWAKRAGGELTEYICMVSVDSLNNIYLTGEFTSRNVTVDTYPMTLTESDGDVLLAKLSPSGNVSWAYVYGEDPTPGSYQRLSCWPVAVKTSAEGNSYVYGWTGNHNYFGPYLLESPYTYGFFLMKVDNSGAVQWAKEIRERGQNWHSLQIGLDGKGNCFVGGNVRDSTWFDASLVIPQGKYDLFLAKYDRDGALGWAKIFGSNPLNLLENYPVQNSLYGLAVYNENSIFAGGTFANDLRFDGDILHSSAMNGFISLLGNDLPLIPPVRNVQNVTVDEGTTRCYNATGTITVAGNGTTFLVKNGGNATLIAGGKISFLPGAKVESGGYVLAKITASGQYCPGDPSLIPGKEMAGSAPEFKAWLPETGNSAYRIYPNPTNGNFTFEVTGEAAKMPVHVEIYSSMGERILNTDIAYPGIRNLSLNGKPRGLYFVRISCDESSAVLKVIKQ